MPTVPSNWVLKRSKAGATTVSSPVDSRRDTEWKGRSLPFTEARCPFTACTVEMLPIGLYDKQWLGSHAYRAFKSLLRRSRTGATTVSFRVDASGTLNGKGNACLFIEARCPFTACHEAMLRVMQYSILQERWCKGLDNLFSFKPGATQSVQGIRTTIDAAAGISQVSFPC